MDYYYRKNIQGDVIAIHNANGTLVASYAYDAWGKCTILVGNDSADSIANINPFRYRSYYYDTETGLYYLETRYYDPEIGRFINADSIEYLDPETIGGLNLFAYCNNNPVMYSDPEGHFPVLAVVLSAIAIIGLITTVVGVATDNDIVTAIGLTAVAVPAMISGGLAVATAGTVTTVVGILTILAGVGTATFASAEYQQSFTGNNWILDSGMSEGWYNGLMLTTATVATLGTVASCIIHALKIKTILEIGRISGVRANPGFPGIRFRNTDGFIKSLEFQWGHGHGLHLQINTWWLNMKGYEGLFYRAFGKHFEIFKFWKGWY